MKSSKKTKKTKMDKKESKYSFTSKCMQEAFLKLLSQKEYAYITVKEICKTAGVNRSTFYLHYETIDDLLEETLESVNQEFFSSFDNRSKNTALSIAQEKDTSKFNFITPEYLIPYLTFVKNNRALFQIGINNQNVVKSKEIMDYIKNDIIKVILDKMKVKKEVQNYIIAFFLEGLIAIIKEWIKNDCKDEISDIIQIMQGCIPLDRL